MLRAAVLLRILEQPSPAANSVLSRLLYCVSCQKIEWWYQWYPLKNCLSNWDANNLKKERMPCYFVLEWWSNLQFQHTTREAEVVTLGILWPCGCTDQQPSDPSTWQPLSLITGRPLGLKVFFLRNPMGTMLCSCQVNQVSGTSQEDSGSGNKWQGAMSTKRRQHIACVCV